MFTNLRVKHKLWLLLFVVISGALSLQIFDRLGEYQRLLESREKEIKHLVESVSALANHYYELSDSIGESEAKKQALDAISKIRYDGGKGYFWINDFNAVMVMHPIKPALNGKDMSSFEDPKGMRLFKEFVNVVKKSNEGYVNYFWDMPGQNEPMPKSSYVKGFQPWNWIIGTGIYINDIEDVFWSSTQKSIFALFIIAIIVSVFAHFITLDIVKPLNAIVRNMKKAATGDLSVTIEPAQRKDELGTLNNSFGVMQNSFKKLIVHSYDSSTQLSELSKTMATITSQTTEGVNQQHIETELLASAIEELATTIQEVSQNAANTSALTTEANNQINLGNEMMTNTIEAIGKVSNDMSQADNVISQLEVDIKQIDSILNVIRNISEQTNLLALNAAIEAARAGESGRGFAVVADEVRSLAQRTHESTEEIQTMTENLQAAAFDAVKVIQGGKEHSTACVENAKTTGECLILAGEKVGEVSDRNTQIASTVEQQGIVANEVSRNVTSIKEVAQETHEGSQALASRSQQLQNLTVETHTLLSTFKI